MPRVKKAVLTELVVSKESVEEEVKTVEHHIPKRCEWIKKEKGTTCFALGLCIYCKAMERPD